VIDPASEGFIVELTANESEIDKFVAELAKGAQMLEVVRSGALGISRLGRSARMRQE
jgi:acetolactate synthase small subunit